MIIDSQNLVSSAQTVTSTAFSTNTIDLSQARDVGVGEQLEFFVNVDQAATAAGAATVTFQVVTSANADLSSPTIVGQTDAIPKASLSLAAQFFIPVPRSFINATGQRYLGLQYTVATGPLTAGKFTAGVVVDAQDKGKLYATGFTVN